MSEFDKYWRKLPNRYGLFLFGLLMAYFFISLALGLAHEYWLRAFNFLFLFGTLWAVVKRYKKETSSSYYEEFFDFFKISMRTAIIGIGLFAIFIAFYLDLINPQFLVEMKEIEQLSPYLTPISAAAILFIEGVGSSFVCSYLVIQILKSKTVEKPAKEQQTSQSKA